MFVFLIKCSDFFFFFHYNCSKLKRRIFKENWRKATKTVNKNRDWWGVSEAASLNTSVCQSSDISVKCKDLQNQYLWPFLAVRFSFLGWGSSAKKKLCGSSDRTVLIKIPKGVCAFSFSSGTCSQSVKFLMDMRFPWHLAQVIWCSPGGNRELEFSSERKALCIYWCCALTNPQKAPKNHPDIDRPVLCVVGLS